MHTTVGAHEAGARGGRREAASEDTNTKSGLLEVPTAAALLSRRSTRAWRMAALAARSDGDVRVGISRTLSDAPKSTDDGNGGGGGGSGSSGGGSGALADDADGTPMAACGFNSAGGDGGDIL